MKPARLELVREVAAYLRDHPGTSANDVVAVLRCRRADGLRAVRVVHETAELPGGLDGRFLKPKGGTYNGACPPLRVISPEEFAADLYRRSGS